MQRDGDAWDKQIEADANATKQDAPTAQTSQRISAAEASARADEIYERSIRPLVKESDRMKYLYIDIESGDFEMDANKDLAEERLRARHPDGFFVMRGDGGAVGHFGFSWV